MKQIKITDDLRYTIESHSVNLYSYMGMNNGADINIDFDEIDAVINALQSIKAAQQSVRPTIESVGSAPAVVVESKRPQPRAANANR